MKRHFPLTIAASLLFTLGLLAPHQAQGQILSLDFAGGNGNTTVDQYTGTAGSGWTTAWTQGFGADTSSATATVVNTSPIYSGGGNYLDVSYNTGSGAARSARVSRQWDTSGGSISLAAPITLSFYFQSDTLVSNSTQSFLFFGSTAASSTTGTNDSWKMTIDGSGVAVYNNNTSTPLVSAALLGTNVANTPIKFTLVIDPVANTYIASATRLDTNVTFTSGTLALRNGGDTSLSYINLVSNGGASQTGLGFSLDGISVVPEPGTAFLMVGGVAMVGLLRRRSRA